jgi:hypothetical protein
MKIKTGFLDGNNISKTSILLLTTVFLFIHFNQKRYLSKNEVIQWDAISYYAYLPAFFIYDDITLEFVKQKRTEKYRIWYDKTEDGKRFLRYTMGMAILYSPFFFLGHISAHLFDYSPWGYSIPYKFFLQLGCIIYVIIGLIFLRKILLRYFSDTVTSIALIAIVLGTNLLYYSTIENTMPHAYNFTLITIFLYLTIRWHEKTTVKNSILIGLVTGLIILVRPIDGLIILFFIFYDIFNKYSVIGKIKYFLNNNIYLLIIIGITITMLFPQFLYWKTVTGKWFFYTYGVSGGNFYFDNPQIINGLFSYRKGLLLYVPVMSIAIIGIPLLYKWNRKFFGAIAIFFVVLIYIIFSWWSWWYGGGFGIRSLIEFYPVLTIPLAYMIHWMLHQIHRIPNLALLIVFVFFVFTGFFHNLQYRYGVIHYDSMTKEVYWDSFMRLKKPPNYWKRLCKPDYELARKGIYKCNPLK